MQTISVEIKDNHIENFMEYINNHSDNISIKKDKNLDYDPYFYERQKELHKLRKDVKSGDMEMLSKEQYDKEIKSFFDDLKK